MEIAFNTRLLKVISPDNAARRRVEAAAHQTSGQATRALVDYLPVWLWTIASNSSLER